MVERVIVAHEMPVRFWPVTPRGITNKEVIVDMKVKFRHSETQKEHTVKAVRDEYYVLESHPMNWSSDCFVAVLKSAVDVVAPPTAPTYKVGQRFCMNGVLQEYLLASVEPKRVALIGLQEGNRWRTPCMVRNVDKITVAEMKVIAGEWNKYTLNPGGPSCD